MEARKDKDYNQDNEHRTTTIKVSELTRGRLNHLKEHKEESADTLINKALNIINICARSPGLAARILRDIEKSKKRKELLDNPESINKKHTSSNNINNSNINNTHRKIQNG